ncbi:YitT family protein [Mycoplasmopsis columbinasalis]|uniref:Uncharacterized BCR, YitT family COG1284 n=1 Tax=Mycoplasmopsis columbinasalis TaxID=114880 RepID=A0A449BAZ7_9BACT|nr:YitT family protein [Mycoplasmopsis columbinasalis]VEU78375.1 Uncharacterized BCR, YitT family COG1284 [Mycoplasmopsis columbinasalis]
MKENQQKQAKFERITEVQRAKIKQSLLTFGTFYRVKSLRWQIVFTVLIGALFGLTQYFVIQITGLYEMGVAAISQATARLMYQVLPFNEVTRFIIYNTIFWLLNFFANVPLFILAYKKIGKRFTLLNLIFMISVTVVGLIISNSIYDSQHLYLFGKLDEHNLIKWTSDNIGDLSILIYGLLWGGLQAIFTAILLIIDSSSAGFDILSVYLSRKKFRDVGSFLMFLHFVSFLFAYFFGSYLTNGLKENQWDMQLLFSPAFVAGLIMVLFNGWILNMLFPKFKMVKVEVITSKPWEIVDKVNELKEYRFSTSVKEMVGGFTRTPQNVVMTTCLYIDAAQILEVANKVDPNAFIMISDLKKVDGYMYITHSEYKYILKKNRKNNTQKPLGEPTSNTTLTATLLNPELPKLETNLTNVETQLENLKAELELVKQEVQKTDTETKTSD